MKWWETYNIDDIEENKILNFDFGSLNIGIQRLKKEWKILKKRTDKAFTLPKISKLKDIDILNGKLYSESDIIRYVFKSTEKELRIYPALADRHVVSKTDNPFYLFSEERISVFVSTPIWIKIEMSDSVHSFEDIPTEILSDTWFGPSTIDGSLAYSGTGTFSVSYDNNAQNPNKVFTEVFINNKTKNSMLVDKINLPVPYLSLFCDSNGRLWTQNITLNLKEEASSADIHIWKKPSPRGDQLVCPARKEIENNMLSRTFAMLFN